MNKDVISAILFLSVFAINSNSYSQDEFPILNGPYLGQKTPGIVAEPFAPGFVSIHGRYEYGISFSPDLDEMFFSANNPDGSADIYYSKLEDNKWQPIQKAKFTQGKKAQEIHPFVSSDGKRIYFTAFNADFTDNKIWYVERLQNSWSNAVKLDSPINDDDVFYLNQAKNGDVFYTNLSKYKMYTSSSKTDKFPKVKAVDIREGIHGFIAPAQDYLLIDARNNDDATRKDKDIYVYFKKKDGTWANPVNLGSSVNSNFDEAVPSVTPDGKYLFFSRYNEEGGISNLYWISTQVIENLRP